MRTVGLALAAARCTGQRTRRHVAGIPQQLCRPEAVMVRIDRALQGGAGLSRTVEMVWIP